MATKFCGALFRVARGPGGGVRFKAYARRWLGNEQRRGGTGQGHPDGGLAGRAFRAGAGDGAGRDGVGGALAGAAGEPADRTGIPAGLGQAVFPHVAGDPAVHGGARLHPAVAQPVRPGVGGGVRRDRAQRDDLPAADLGRLRVRAGHPARPARDLRAPRRGGALDREGRRPRRVRADAAGGGIFSVDLPDAAGGVGHSRRIRFRSARGGPGRHCVDETSGGVRLGRPAGRDGGGGGRRRRAVYVRADRLRTGQRQDIIGRPGRAGRIRGGAFPAEPRAGHGDGRRTARHSGPAGD